MNARKSIAVIVIALLALAPRLGRASERGEEREGANVGATEHDGDRAGVKESAEGVDTQFIFGFTMGADVGEPGEKEIEWETVNRPLKSAGSYAALEASSGPSSRRMSAFASSSVSRSLKISGVPGLYDRQRGAFNGVDFECGIACSIVRMRRSR